MPDIDELLAQTNPRAQVFYAHNLFHKIEQDTIQKINAKRKLEGKAILNAVAADETVAAMMEYIPDAYALSDLSIADLRRLNAHISTWDHVQETPDSEESPPIVGELIAIMYAFAFTINNIMDNNLENTATQTDVKQEEEVPAQEPIFLPETAHLYLACQDYLDYLDEKEKQEPNTTSIQEERKIISHARDLLLNPTKKNRDACYQYIQENSEVFDNLRGASYQRYKHLKNYESELQSTHWDSDDSAQEKRKKGLVIYLEAYTLLADPTQNNLDTYQTLHKNNRVLLDEAYNKPYIQETEQTYLACNQALSKFYQKTTQPSNITHDDIYIIAQARDLLVDPTYANIKQFHQLVNKHKPVFKTILPILDERVLEEALQRYKEYTPYLAYLEKQKNASSGDVEPTTHAINTILETRSLLLNPTPDNMLLYHDKVHQNEAIFIDMGDESYHMYQGCNDYLAYLQETSKKHPDENLIKDKIEIVKKARDHLIIPTEESINSFFQELYDNKAILKRSHNPQNDLFFRYVALFALSCIGFSKYANKRFFKQETHANTFIKETKIRQKAMKKELDTLKSQDKQAPEEHDTKQEQEQEKKSFK
jgi:uncharacterized short protein YbdD (DUF466 family)